MNIEEILIVRHENVGFGIETSWIGQILRVPEMTSLALSPKEVHGMCAVGGNITTAVDLNLLLGLRKADIRSQKSRILTLNGAFGSTALVVPEVVETIVTEPERLEYVADTREPIRAIYHHGDELIQIVDVERILQSLRIAAFTPREIADKSEGGTTIAGRVSENGRYLLFRMGGEVYALGIDNLREILAAQQSITPLSGSDPEILGMMSLRDELVLVVDLRLHYGLAPNPSEKNRILIAQFDQKVIGLMIDEIIDIKEYEQARIERFGESAEASKTAGIVHDDEHLVSLVSEATIRSIIGRNEGLIVASDTLSEETRSDILLEAVLFRLGREEYAIDIERVAEIIDKTPVTPVAQAPETVDGVVNIRGQIVTIGSLHRRLGIAPGSEEEQKIVICDTPKGRMGFFVDGVSDVRGIYGDEMHEEGDPNSPFSHILHFENGERLVLLLDLDRTFGA